MNFISIIIPAFNEEKYISKCIQSLQKQSYPRELYEIIVVDNGSTDSTLSIAEEAGAITFIKDDCNVGAVRNYGVKKAQGDILAFIDADCTVDEDWITKGVNLLSSTKNTIFGGGCLLKDNPVWIEKYWLLGTPENRLPKDLIGCSIFIKRKNFELVDGFNESITSGEDTKLSYELSKKGNDIRISPEISVIHLGNALTIKDFIKRQVWHSENYLKDIKASIKDPIFFLSFLTLAGLFFGLAILFIDKETSLKIFGLTLIIPSILSFKRIIRAKLTPKALIHIHQIYTLDLLYIIGRAFGLIKGLFKMNSMTI